MFIQTPEQSPKAGPATCLDIFFIFYGVKIYTNPIRLHYMKEWFESGVISPEYRRKILLLNIIQKNIIGLRPEINPLDIAMTPKLLS